MSEPLTPMVDQLAANLIMRFDLPVDPPSLVRLVEYVRRQGLRLEIDRHPANVGDLPEKQTLIYDTAGERLRGNCIAADYDNATVCAIENYLQSRPS